MKTVDGGGTRTSPFRLRINDELAYKVTVMSRRMSRRRLGPAGYLKHRRRRRRPDTRLMTEGLTPRARPGRPTDLPDRRSGSPFLFTESIIIISP